MKLMHVRMMLFFFPVIALVLLMMLLLVQQGLQEKAMPEQVRPLPRVVVPIISVENVTYANESQASEWLMRANKSLQELERLSIPHHSFLVSFDEMARLFRGENVNELLLRADLLNETPDQQKYAEQIYALVNAAIKTGQPLGANYTFVVREGMRFVERAAVAKNAMDALRLLQITLDGLDGSLNLSSAIEFQRSAVSEYERENFEAVFGLVNQAFSAAEEAKVELSKSRAFFKASRRTVWFFVIDQWSFLLGVIVVLSVIGWIVNNEVQIMLLRSSQEKTRSDLNHIGAILKRTQEEYYQKLLAPYVYQSRVIALHKKKQILQRELPVMNKKLAARNKLSVRRLLQFKK